ncbi:regulatory protein, luxR family [Micromonospora narathiwatensis]|uniref:Regulatory protein, luxR family n=1 Tax=Micromonospora narathiwatensis TaxID=299146 RepID=A0A1A8ZNK2_9ACTN|nr:regulatory protein, luxR family [Micromonospora narathiwatensis]
MSTTDPLSRTAPAHGRTASIQPAATPGSTRSGRRRTAVDAVLAGLTLPLVGFAVADLVNPDWSPVETMVSHYDIAGQLVISPLTAKTHVTRAIAKLGVRDRVQLVILAYETGLVRPGEAGPGFPGRQDAR